MKTAKCITAHMFSETTELNNPSFMSSHEIELPVGTQIRNVKKGDSFIFEFNKGQDWVKAVSLTDPLSE